ncbi:UV radiation resistance-associated gene protein [Drosophila tropicalis]|uniref:UV radiation resistance-associated gene protein n=1 Tax=Drosophila tropicalis TaxID=46794 RepID=UPI0035AB8163
MNLRPRCRKWLPLATQQLRIRNLARIQGVNIDACGAVEEPESDMLLYYTLHADKASKAFYTSEKLPQRHQYQKWAEISAVDDVWRKSNLKCVCVKVWKQQEKHEQCQPSETETKIGTKEEKKTTLCKLQSTQLTPYKLTRPPELVFTWGVYFSGLTPLAPLTAAQCGSNCLIFHLNGEQFTSPSMISEQGLHYQLHLQYQNYGADEEPDETERPENQGINSPPASRSSSPMLRMRTMRYAQLKCHQQEIRHSYNLEYLLQLQRQQRMQQLELQGKQEKAEEIKRISVQCITQNELNLKPRTRLLYGEHNHHHQHSMGRTLSVLLAEQQEIAPITLFNAQRLIRNIEGLRCKQRLLLTDRQTFRERIEKQKERLATLRETLESKQKELHSQRLRLEQDRLELRLQIPQHLAKREQRQQITRQVERRMSTLVLELQEIFNIQSTPGSQLYNICGISFPHMEQYTSESRQAANAQMLQHVSPLAVSAALGYVAHLVQMLAIIMDRPLRNRILYEPSRARIVDEIKELTYATREFPLYTRSILPSQQTKYAIYLLRQNVSQLCYDITGHCDLRNTFGNLLELFNTLRYIERTQRDEVDSPDDNGGIANLVNGLSVAAAGNNSQLSQSHSSVDMNHVPLPTTANVAKDSLLQQLLPLPPGVSQALAIEGYASTQRICRSVGSYSDGEEEFPNKLEHNYSNSDSNITRQSERS